MNERISALDVANRQMQHQRETVAKLTKDNKRLRSYLRTFKDEANYVGYLQMEISVLEDLYADQLEREQRYQMNRMV